ncbi:hypothetical protein HJC23_001022 [Cyclotella cryptica]|uniref:Nudix hydrolase domain-containing protein n=1 Tax=Cyclotella cryptica TaxID=29204 RepID=A0ABD3P2B8_9STRA|eukprot:CCRYP_018012-RA/>CCRYP_018012-RA protein AED:0.06 eAED:0.05 QI:0/-1/0/1/-1/1/1/0/535
MDRSPTETRVRNGDDSPHTAQNSSRRHLTHETVKRTISSTNSSSDDKNGRNSSNLTGRKSDGMSRIENGRADFRSGERSHGTDNKSKIRGQTRTHNKTRSNASTSTIVKIETSNFQSNFHMNMVRAAKYKVHAPNCSCPKVKTIREKYMVSRQSTPQKQNDEQCESTAETNTTTPAAYNGSILFDIDGTISQQFGKKLHLSEPGHIVHASKQECDESDWIFNNLIVLPDTHRPSAVYVCKGTDSKKFAENGTACEQKLSMEIFDSNFDSTINGVDECPSFKVSCAICLLTSHYRNGFVAMVSDSLDKVQPFVRRARSAAEAKRGRGLHSDHAHFVCALEIPSLQSLLRSGKTRSAALQFNWDILIQMKDAGVALSTDVESFITSVGKVTGQDIEILLGHHLSSLLYIIANQCQNKTLSISSNQTIQLQYIMIIGYQEGTFKWKLDLPGGKRHLGESTLEGVIREVEEECSLRLDRKWMEDLVPLEYGGGADSYDRLNEPSSEISLDESSREISGGFVRVFETTGDAFLVMIPSLR